MSVKEIMPPVHGDNLIGYVNEFGDVCVDSIDNDRIHNPLPDDQIIPNNPDNSGLEWERRFDEIEALADKFGCSLGEAAARLGIENPDEKRRENRAKAAERVLYMASRERVEICGDCLRELKAGESCSHMRIGPRGGIYRSDDPDFLRPTKKRKKS